MTVSARITVTVELRNTSTGLAATTSTSGDTILSGEHHRTDGQRIMSRAEILAHTAASTAAALAAQLEAGS